jgi:N-acetylglucosamine kinase-like BadF-type ATPase
MSDNAGGIILAIDGGGTTTRCLAIDSAGVIRGSAEGGPSNHILNSWDTVTQSIEKALRGALSDASIPPQNVACISLGTAGIGPGGEGKEQLEDLAREILPVDKATATGDMVIAFHGAIMEDCGVVANAGTGSVIYGRSASGAYRQVGGWGHVLGDEGSAYDIAVAGLRAAARCMDGRGELTSLIDLIPQGLDVSDMVQVAFKVYGLNMSREEIARLASIVAEAAAGGDMVSRSILRAAAEELALGVTVAIRELGLDGLRIPVSYVGSVFDSGELVIRPFAEAVTMKCPQATVLPPKFPAVIGAFILGAGEVGWSVSAQTLMNVKHSLLSR